MKTTEITIKAGTTFEMPLLVSKPGTTVHWVFHTKGYDIRFGIAKNKAGADREYIVSNTSYSPDSPQQGKVTFPTAGDYFLVWDNTYSWIREKHVVYSVEIVFPDLTLEEQTECARYPFLFTLKTSTILQDVESMKQDILRCEDKQVERKEHIHALEQQRSLKCEQLEAIKVV